VRVVPYGPPRADVESAILAGPDPKAKLKGPIPTLRADSELVEAVFDGRP